MVVLFVSVNHEQVSVELIRIHFLRFFHFTGNTLDLTLLLFNELANFLLQLLLLPIETAMRGLVFAEVGLDESEVAPRILGQAMQFQRENDFFALDRIDVSSRHAFQALAKGFDRAAPGETVCR